MSRNYAYILRLVNKNEDLNNNPQLMNLSYNLSFCEIS